MQTQAVTLLFGATDGANFAWGRIPMGASDYAVDRYTCDDTGTDVTPDSSESNRPPADTSLSKFSLDRDGQKLIPYIKAAQARQARHPLLGQPLDATGVDEDRLQEGQRCQSARRQRQEAVVFRRRQHEERRGDPDGVRPVLHEVRASATRTRASTSRSSLRRTSLATTRTTRRACGTRRTYATFIGQHLGPAMKALSVKVMLGTLSNRDSGKDIDIAQCRCGRRHREELLSRSSACSGACSTR